MQVGAPRASAVSSTSQGTAGEEPGEDRAAPTDSSLCKVRAEQSCSERRKALHSENRETKAPVLINRSTSQAGAG